MATSLNQLGAFQFVRWTNSNDPAQGAPVIVQEDVEPIQRPGVDGTVILLRGTKGHPFTMESGVDVITQAFGMTVYRRYRRLIGQPPQSMIWRGLDMDSTGTRYFVIGVGRPILRPITAVSGGITGSSATCWLSVAWTLIPQPQDI